MIAPTTGPHTRSAQSSPVQSSPVQSSQAQSQSSPVQSSPVQSSPVQSSPVQSSPVQPSPVQSSPGYLVRIHKVPRKALFQPERTCPVPRTQLEDYRRTIVVREDNNNEDITDQYNALNKHQQRRVPKGQPWTGETWFRVKPGTSTAITTTPPATARLATKGKHKEKERATVPQATTTPQQPEQQKQMTSQPAHRYTTKTSPSTTTAIPHPKDVKATADYWIREGHYWKRVHIQLRTAFYIPEQTDDGPDISKLKPWRQTLAVATSDKAQGNSYEDNWTDKPNKALQHEWTGSTNFEENVDYNAEYITDEEDRPQQTATRATGIAKPKQPTAQQRAEHELTHLPYRTWCDICVRTKGKANSHPRQKSKQPVIQVDIAYIKSLDDKTSVPILTAIDGETGMSMATLIQHFEYLVNCMCNFLIECGRAQAILTNTILQSDQEKFLVNLLKATALRMGNNVAVRQSAAYNSQSQGSIERFHRKLSAHIRTLRAQVQQNYDRNISAEQPLMPWLARHANFLLNRYLVHNTDGLTSYYRRWNKQHASPLCIFAETVQYMADPQDNAEVRTEVLQRSMARQGHSNRRAHPGDRNTRCQSTNNPETGTTREL